MDARNLGRTGLKVSPLCLGTMTFGWMAGEEQSFEILNAAWQAGINFIDTADIYSRWVEGNPGGVSETIIGRWIKKFNIPRHQIVLATKVRGPMGNAPNQEGLSRQHIIQAVEDSLRRLNTDYIDLYQAHWFDADTPIEETLCAFNDLIRQGKVRYIGASNYPAWRLMQALWASDRHNLARFDSLQPHYNLVHREEYERELAEVCREYRLGVIPYSPLAGGFLTGKYRREQIADSPRAKGIQERYFTEQNWALLDKMDTLAAEKNCTLSQLALAWHLANSLITSPIIGPHTRAQLEDNLGALEVDLSAKEMDSLNAKD